MKIKKSFYSVGILIALSLLALPGCGPIGQLIIESVPPVSGIVTAQENAVDTDTTTLPVEDVDTAPAAAFTSQHRWREARVQNGGKSPTPGLGPAGLKIDFPWGAG